MCPGSAGPSGIDVAEAAPVVLDLEQAPSRLAAQPDGDRRRAGVLAGVRHRLLRDPEQRPRDLGRQPVGVDRGLHR